LPAVFSREFSLSAPPQDSVLLIRVFKQGTLQINGQAVNELTLQEKDWKRPRTLDVSRYLRAGSNTLTVTVSNAFGPPALSLSLEAGQFKLDTDAEWRVSLAGAVSQNAAIAATPPPIRPGNPLFGREHISSSLRHSALSLVLFFVFSLALIIAVRFVRHSKAGLAARMREFFNEPKHPFFRRYDPAVLSVLGLLVLLWGVLFGHNPPLIAPLVGFDRDGHTEYINYILEHGSLPLADAGWQMYQPPLYYLICAGLLGPFDLTASTDSGLMILRVFSALTGIAQVVMVFFCLRVLFPAQRGLQIVGILLAALLPANLYLSHHPTNEGLAALFVTIALYFTLRLVRADSPSRKLQIAAGAALGLALLTKFSAVLAVPLVFLALAWKGFESTTPNRKPAARLYAGMLACIVPLLVMLIISGWHYARVYNRFGNPLIGNWDPKLPFAWWQDPGFRTSSWYWRFGNTFVTPLFSSIFSFGDGLYSSLWGDGLGSGSARVGFRPQWNYDLMNAGYLLAIPLTLLALCGAVRLLRDILRRPTPVYILLGGLLAAFAFGMIFMTLRVASYAQVKAFYALPALLPFCLLLALGWEWLSKQGPLWRGVLWTLLITWSVTTYSAHWISARAPFTYTARGLSIADDGKYAEAAQEFSRALALDANAPGARVGLASALDRQQKFEEARQQLEAELQQRPNNADALAEAAVNVGFQGHYDQAAEKLRQAIALAPDHPNAFQQLAICLGWLGKKEETIQVCREGLRVTPYNPRLHKILADAALELRDLTNAITHFRYEVELQPDQPDKLNNLAWLLASNPDPHLRNGPEAVALAERACELTRREQPVLLGTLAAAYAEAGMFREAIATAQQACDLATAAGQTEVAKTNRELMEIYRAGKAWHQPPGM